MAAVGSVTIGSKMIDIHSFTGTVTKTARTTDSATTYDGEGRITRSSKYSYNKFFVEGSDGSWQEAEFDTRQANPSEGDRVTLFWGVVQGKESDYLALYNHSSAKLGVVWETRNVLAGPGWLYNRFVLGMIAVLFLVFFIATIGAASVFIVLMLVGLWYWLFRRRAKLVDAVRETIPKVKSQLSSSK